MYHSLERKLLGLQWMLKTEIVVLAVPFYLLWASFTSNLSNWRLLRTKNSFPSMIGTYHSYLCSRSLPNLMPPSHVCPEIWAQSCWGNTVWKQLGRGNPTWRYKAPHRMVSSSHIGEGLVLAPDLAFMLKFREGCCKERKAPKEPESRHTLWVYHTSLWLVF